MVNKTKMEVCEKCKLLGQEWIDKKDGGYWIYFCKKDTPCKDVENKHQSILILICPVCGREITLDYISGYKKAIFHCWECQLHFLISPIDIGNSNDYFQF